MISDPWFPLLALLERTVSDGSQAAPTTGSDQRFDRPPSARLREAVIALCQVLREELGHDATGQQVWLLLDTGGGGLPPTPPSPLEVGRVMDELRQRFQALKPSQDGAVPPDFEAFLRDKMRSLGFEDLSTSPLLPELQREALRGLGVGLGSQMAQMVGRLAGWHGDPKATGPKSSEESKPAAGPKLLRLELGTGYVTDRTLTIALRHELGKVRKRVSQHLGWEVCGFTFTANKDLEGLDWRLVLRGDEVASGHQAQQLIVDAEQAMLHHAEALFPFAEFEAMTRQPGCKLVIKELRHLGLEKALVWTVCRRALAAGGHLRDPLTTFERVLEASMTSQQLPFLVQAALSLPD